MILTAVPMDPIIPVAAEAHDETVLNDWFFANKVPVFYR